MAAAICSAMTLLIAAAFASSRMPFSSSWRGSRSTSPVPHFWYIDASASLKFR
jgi:hypothetical protein